MLALRVIVLCVAAALICVLLRQQRPELAMLLSLATGIGVLLIFSDSFRQIAEIMQRLMDAGTMKSEYTSTVLKAAGISIISELGVQICCDAGESALAGRIKLACRIAMLMIALPGLGEIMEIVAAVAD